uniref:Uncharacterized protein n=1 Tax=Rheinheimera sp. BAL341 TaxID=1708203 RepID=A0A486XFR3_9GAMM
MKLEQLKMHYEAGDLKIAVIYRDKFEGDKIPGWVTKFIKHNGVCLTLELEKGRDGIRCKRTFKSLNAAFAACKRVGFTEVDVKS